MKQCQGILLLERMDELALPSEYPFSTLGFRVQGLGLRVQGLRFRACGLRF